MASKRVRLGPQHFDGALAAAVAAFPLHNEQGVFGAAIRRKAVHGRPQPFFTLTVFVRRKLLEPSAPVQALVFEHAGRSVEVVPDVVATGEGAAAGDGQAAHFTGLHAGAAIRVRAGHDCSGGVACLLGNGGDPTHLVTAGHLFPPSAGEAAVEAALTSSAAPETIGTLELNLLDRPGAGDALDAALVALTAAGVRMAKRSGTAARLPRLFPGPFDSRFVESTWLRVFLPLTGDYVANLEGECRPNSFFVRSGCRDAHVVKNVVTTGHAQNSRGNSGTVLLSDNRSGSVQGHGVGVAVGFAGGISLHEPLDRVLRRLASSTGRQWSIWSQP